MTVDPVNDAPKAESQTVTTAMNTSVVITLTGYDIEDDPLKFYVSPPDKGTLYQFSASLPLFHAEEIVANDTRVTDDGGRVVFVPPPHGVGDPYTSFVFSADDGLLGSDTDATVEIRVISPEELTALPLTALGDEDSEVTIHFKAENVPEGASFETTLQLLPHTGRGRLYEAKADGSKGVQLQSAPTTVTNNTVIYVPPNNLNGNVTEFSYFVTSGGVQSALATVTVSLEAVNDRPTAVNLNHEQSHHDDISIEFLGDDVDGDTLVAVVRSLPTLGTLYLNGSEITSYPADVPAPYAVLYVCESSRIYRESFFYTMFDGTVESEWATVTVLVGGDNVPPHVKNMTVDTTEDTPVVVALNVTDEDSPSFETRVVAPPDASTGSLYQVLTTMTGFQEQGALIDENDVVEDEDVRTLFVPAPNFFGTTTFTYQVEDNSDGLSEVATVTVQVASATDPPSANDTTVLVQGQVPFKITLEASSVEVAATLELVFDALPPRGTLYTSSQLDTPIAVGTVLRTDTVWFAPEQDGGGYPYCSFQFRALVANSDNSGFVESATATVTLVVDCPAGFVNHVFSVGGGDVCVECPTGALCDRDGKHQPVNAAGYWAEPLATGVVFVPCASEDACPAGSFDESHSGVANTVCGSGYSGLRCDECEVGYYPPSLVRVKRPSARPAGPSFFEKICDFGPCAAQGLAF